MRKIYLLFMAVAILLTSISQSLSAQTTAGDGLINVSDDDNTYWYYIENGHNASGGIINDNDGRYCGLVTINALNDASLAIMPIFATKTERDQQKWKVVAVPETTDTYYLINKSNGEYMVRNADPLLGTTAVESEAYKFKFTKTGTFVKIETTSLASSNKLEGQNRGNAWRVIFSGGGDPGAATSGAFLTGNPRGWRMVPEAELDNFYPVMYAQNTASTDIIEWFYIKSLDASKSDKYLTVSESGSFSLADKNTLSADSQLFGFISGGVVAPRTNGDDSGTKMYIYHKGTGKYLSNSSGLALSSTPSSLYLKHVYSPKNANQETQGVIRTQRHSGAILTNSFTMPNIAYTYDTYDNQYAWAYEKIPASQATVTTASPYITITSSPTTDEVEYDQPFVVTYKVTAGYAPLVTVNGLPGPIGVLSGDTYTLSLNIKATTTIDITASEAFNVTVNEGEGVTIESPSLDGQNKYISANTSVITFTLNEGYTNPQVAAIGAQAGAPVQEGSIYSVTLTEIQDGATIGISASLIDLSMSVSKNEGINWVGETPASSAKYFANYTISFSVAVGYHTPKVAVNKEYYTPVLEGSTYTVALTDVREAYTIAIEAYPINVVPAKEDTYVNGNTTTVSSNFYNDSRLFVQYSSSTGWTRRGYVAFDVPQTIDPSYDKICLRLTVSSIQQDKGNNPTIEVRSVTDAGLPDFDKMTWTLNGETLAAKGTPVSSVFVFPRSTANGESVDIDITEYVLANAGSEIKLLINGLNTAPAYDGNIYFHSLEGAAAQNLAYAPSLVFGQASTEWEGSIDSNWRNADNWNGTFIPDAGDDITIPNVTQKPTISFNAKVNSLTIKAGASIQLTETTTLTVNEPVSVEQSVAKFQWYPIGFPFAARAHYMDFGADSELKLASYAADTNADFWLKAYSGTEFAYMTTYPMAAGTGYIAQYPSAFNNKTITYISEGTDPVVLSNGSITAESEVYKLVANPTLSAMTLKSENGTFYYTFDGSKFIILEEGSEATVQPFEAFIVVSTETPDLLKSSIGSDDGDLTGIETEIAPKGKVIEVRYYNLQGARIAAPVANEVYIEKAVYESGEEVVTKIVNSRK